MTAHRPALTVVASVIAGALAGAGGTAAQTNLLNPPDADPKVVSSTRDMPSACRWTFETDGQIGLACNPQNRGWVLRHNSDIEGGRLVRRPDGTVDRTALNLNLSGGDHRHRGYVVVSPDNGKGLIVEDGHLRKLLLVRAPLYGGTEFRTPVRFERRVTVLSNGRTVDVGQELARLAQHVK